MKTYTIQIDAALRGQTRADAQREIDEHSVKLLTDAQLEQATFWQEIRDTGAKLFLRRESMRRWVESDDVEKIQALVETSIFESISSLFENADHHGRTKTIAGYNSNGEGVEIDVSKISYYIGQID